MGPIQLGICPIQWYFYQCRYHSIDVWLGCSNSSKQDTKKFKTDFEFFIVFYAQTKAGSEGGKYSNQDFDFIQSKTLLELIYW